MQKWQFNENKCWVWNCRCDHVLRVHFYLLHALSLPLSQTHKLSFSHTPTQTHAFSYNCCCPFIYIFSTFLSARGALQPSTLYIHVMDTQSHCVKSATVFTTTIDPQFQNKCQMLCKMWNKCNNLEMSNFSAFVIAAITGMSCWKMQGLPWKSHCEFGSCRWALVSSKK